MTKYDEIRKKLTKNNNNNNKNKANLGSSRVQ